MHVWMCACLPVCICACVHVCMYAYEQLHDGWLKTGQLHGVQSPAGDWTGDWKLEPLVVQNVASLPGSKDEAEICQNQLWLVRHFLSLFKYFTEGVPKIVPQSGPKPKPGWTIMLWHTGHVECMHTPVFSHPPVSARSAVSWARPPGSHFRISRSIYICIYIGISVYPGLYTYVYIFRYRYIYRYLDMYI